MVRVVALKDHSPDGNKRYKAGDRYSISAKSAKLLVAMKFVRHDVEEDPGDPSKSKGKYKHRSMQAEK